MTPPSIRDLNTYNPEGAIAYSNMLNELTTRSEGNPYADSFFFHLNTAPNALRREIGKDRDTLFFIPVLAQDPKDIGPKTEAQNHLQRYVRDVLSIPEGRTGRPVDNELKMMNEEFPPITVGMKFPSNPHHQPFIYAIYPPNQYTHNKYGILIIHHDHRVALREYSNLLDIKYIKDFKVLIHGCLFTLGTPECDRYVFEAA